MKVVIASEGGPEGNAAVHFAHCSHFVVFDIESGTVRGVESVKNPHRNDHIPGIIPDFVKSLGADVLITDGIGPRAVELLKSTGIDVISGVAGKVGDIIRDYVDGKLKPADNPCHH